MQLRKGRVQFVALILCSSLLAQLSKANASEGAYKHFIFQAPKRPSKDEYFRVICENSSQPKCTLKTLTLFTKMAANENCKIFVVSVFRDEPAVLSGNTWLVTRKEPHDVCERTETYIITPTEITIEVTGNKKVSETLQSMCNKPDEKSKAAIYKKSSWEVEGMSLRGCSKVDFSF